MNVSVCRVTSLYFYVPVPSSVESWQQQFACILNLKVLPLLCELFCSERLLWPTLIRLLRRGIGFLLAESEPALSHVGDSQPVSFWTLFAVSDTVHFPFDTGSPRCVSRLVPAPPDAAFRQPATGGPMALLFSAMVTLSGIPQFS